VEGVRLPREAAAVVREEQRQRFQERIDDPRKRWKFSMADLDERKLWDKYIAAYEDAISKCSTDYAPWYVIPANDKAYRDWAVSKIVTETLAEMNPKYPKPKLVIPRLIKRLKD